MTKISKMQYEYQQLNQTVGRNDDTNKKETLLLRQIANTKAALGDYSTAVDTYIQSANKLKSVTSELQAEEQKYIETLDAESAAFYRVMAAANAAANAKAKAAQPVTQETQYHARGGVARGTDTIPAMLTPGEAVINARATAKNLARLVPMNLTHQEPRFAKSGPVTNVGDLHVSIAGGGSTNQTASELGRALRREIQRGVLAF